MIAQKYKQIYTEKDAEFFSEALDIQDCVKFSVQITTSNSDSLDATCTLQVCNNEDFGWVDLSSAETLVDNDIHVFDVTDSSTGYTRVKIEFAAGSADFTFDWVMKKEDI